MKLLSIDPGTTETAYCLIDGDTYRVLDKAKAENGAVLQYINDHKDGIDHIAVEMIASYGMGVGAEVFETCTWIGRFELTADLLSIPHDRVFRMEEKQMICHDSRAKDSNIRLALIDRFAQHDHKRGTGTKGKPDWFYGFRADIWAAYAVGVVWLDKRKEAVK